MEKQKCLYLRDFVEQSSVLIAWFVNMNCYGVTLCGVLVLYATEWLQIYEALFPPITTEKKILVPSCSKGRERYPTDQSLSSR